MRRGGQISMKSNFRAAIILAAAISGSAGQLICEAQSAPSTQDKNATPQKIAGAVAVHQAMVEYPAMEGPETGPAKSGSDSTSSASAAANSTAAAAKPADTTNSATPASVSVPINSEAAIKELSEVKKQFAQMESEMKARIAKLESQLGEASDAATA